MITARGTFRFMNPHDYVALLMNSDAGGLPQIGHDQDDSPFVIGEDGEMVYLLVSEHEPQGLGMQDEPTPSTLRALAREARLAGRPLPWQEK